jgi:hypothetical protein
MGIAEAAMAGVVIADIVIADIVTTDLVVGDVATNIGITYTIVRAVSPTPPCHFSKTMVQNCFRSHMHS